jgi:hypothetical protein
MIRFGKESPEGLGIKNFRIRTQILVLALANTMMMMLNALHRSVKHCICITLMT